jgi:hypothetical protein
MAKFNSANLDPTEYDFTEFPNKSGEGFCSGKGVISEPSDEQVDAFQTAAMSLEKAGKSDDTMKFSAARAQTTQALTELNVPQEHLDELPPKYYLRFVGFVLGEFLPGNELGA